MTQRKTGTMMRRLLAGLSLSAALLLPVSEGLAQGRGANLPPGTPGSNRMAEFWAAKPSTLTPYVAPNRVHWKLSEILASHRGRADWVQPLVRNPEQEADYISMGPGKRTKPAFYADDRVVFIVWDGQLRVSVAGREPFVATKGFMVNIPARHIFTLETVGDRPSLRMEARQAGAPLLYPASETPDPRPGFNYIKTTGTPGPWVDRDTNPLYLDFFKTLETQGRVPTPVFRDDHFTVNAIRGAAAPVPPDTDLGHFHVGITEFWFVMEGSIGFKIEGFPYFKTEPGDVVAAVKGRWHRTGNDPSAPFSTRIPINPRPPALHVRELPRQ